MREHFGLLFARPSFIEGVARTLDIAGTLDYYNYASSGQEADRLAIRADILALREDLEAVREKLKSEGIYSSTTDE